MHRHFFISRRWPKPMLIRPALINICLIWALIMQSAFAPALKGDNSAGSYFCAQNISLPSAQGRAALATLLRAAGQDISQIPANTGHEHCDKCLSGLSAVMDSADPARPVFSKPKPIAARPLQVWAANTIRGPPLGCRAPPIFV